MSNHYQIVAFVDLDDRDAAEAERTLLELLRERGIAGVEISRNRNTELQLLKWFIARGLTPEQIHRNLETTQRRNSLRKAYDAGRGARKAVTGPPFPEPSLDAAFGITFVTGWACHGPVDGGYVGTCPACAREQSGLSLVEGPLAEATIQLEDDSSATLACTECQDHAALRNWKFQPPLFVAPLALEFGNWGPLAPAFIGELGIVAGSRAHVTRMSI